MKTIHTARNISLQEIKNVKGVGYSIIDDQTDRYMVHILGIKDNEVCKSNANLVFEAFNVANETGFTPRQLLEQRNELLEFAIEMVKRYPNSPWIYEQGNKAIQKTK